MKYVSIDIETSGLDPTRDQVLEVAAVIDDLENQLPLEDLPSLSMIARRHRVSGSPVALAMHTRIFRAMSGEGCVDPAGICGVLASFLRDNGFDTNGRGQVVFTPAGKNWGSFDLQFLKQLTGFASLSPRHRSVDPAILFARPEDVALPSLQECAQRAGLEKTEVAHTALDDARMVVELVRIGMGGRDDR